jgi:hypothetical protein
MGEADKTFNKSNNGQGSTTTGNFSQPWDEFSDDGPTMLELFANAPEFENFKLLLRRAAQLLTVADFVRLRKSYDAAWLNVIAEL